MSVLSTNTPQSPLTQAACSLRLQAQMLIILDQVRHRLVDMGSSRLDVSEVPGEPDLYDPLIA